MAERQGHAMEEADAKQPSKTFEDATPLLKNPTQLRAQAERDGYLFFKGLLPKDRLLEVRRRMLELLQQAGYLAADRPLMEGAADVEAIHRLVKGEQLHKSGVGVPLELYEQVQRLEAFHALAHEPRLRELFECLLQGEIFAHPRNIARLMLPHRELVATPSHQDFLHVQGAAPTWTCWIPLGDAPRELGSLTILEGSHRAGLLGVTEAVGAGGLESILCGLGYEWAAGDYELGDFVAFHSLTVHKALPGRVKDRVRLSADLRFQRMDEAIDAGSLLPHMGGDWPQIYAGWTRRELQYYWQDRHPEIVPYDETIRWQKEKIC
ncbi:phytanoyl-CoA dioxygenase family protein [Paenibacillus sp. IB182496]|uniref:Phytanoyl-CoA dioxygenase family protein n=1 Tax=Paenibacillus sabuli TaxID=2772509 RepID=A0A927GQB4_9BACL|nr:phytanoyl-CoA dioxygenase family protein [Paenibacillus sabuli]MBD2844203.1 phytanoyl-CoA dioxygenase family protein [Paenibacillus sabuli]